MNTRSTHVCDELAAQVQLGDSVLLVTIALRALAAIILGFVYDDSAQAWSVSILLA